MSDLVKRLRDAWGYYQYSEQKDHTLLREAADLIEQQQQRNDELAATVERLIAAGNEMSAAIDACLQRIKDGDK